MFVHHAATYQDQAQGPRWLLPAALGATALAVSLGVMAPQNPLDVFGAGLDKVEHFAAFFVLTGLALWRSEAVLLKLAMLLEAAAAIEVVQGLFIPTRSASFNDFAWSATGVIAAAWIVWIARDSVFRIAHAAFIKT